jgi:hypothetical protein
MNPDELTGATTSEFVASACVDLIAHPLGDGDRSAYIPDHGNCNVTARTLQGMVRAGPAASTQHVVV